MYSNPGQFQPFRQSVPYSNPGQFQPFHQSVPYSNPGQFHPFHQSVPYSNPGQFRPFHQSVPYSNPGQFQTFRQSVPYSNPGQFRPFHQSVPSQLHIFLDYLKKLINEESEKHDAEFLKKENAEEILLEIEMETKKHTTEISNILLWIATHHPEILKDEAKELQDISVKRLYFLTSWEFPDWLLVPTHALTTLLKSKVCRHLKTFCGSVKSEVLNHFPENMWHIRLALGRHTEVKSILEILKCRRHKIFSRYYTEKNYIMNNEDISIHLRCGDVDLEDLAPLTDVGPKVYISDVNDHNVAWVVQAVTALQPNDELPYIDTLHLLRSNLTAVGVEAIAKGLCDAGIKQLEIFGISSPNLGNESKDSSDSEDMSVDDSSDSSDLVEMILDKYKLGCKMIFSNDDERFEFTAFTDYIPDHSTAKEYARVLEEMSKQIIYSENPMDDQSDDSNYEDLPEDYDHLLKVIRQQIGDSSVGHCDLSIMIGVLMGIMGPLTRLYQKTFGTN